MSKTILRLDSSVFGNQGVSAQLNDHLVEQIRAQHGDVRVLQRDLAQQALPHVTSEFIGALGKSAGERTPEEAAQVALADQLIDELRQADYLLVGAPMYNFTIPSTLKTWMDYVARAGDTFKYTANGAVGLLTETQVFISASRGGVHRDQYTDNVVPLLTSFFSLLGLSDIHVIYAEGVNMGDDGRNQALTAARQAIESVAA